MEQWIRVEPKAYRGASNLWKGLVKAFPILERWVPWKIGKGNRVRLGEDPWIGVGYKYSLSVNLKSALKARGHTSLANIGLQVALARGRQD